MKLSIAAELVYTFAEATQVIACLEASHTADQTVLSNRSTYSRRSNWFGTVLRQVIAEFAQPCPVEQPSATKRSWKTICANCSLSGRQHVWSELQTRCYRSSCRAVSARRTNLCASSGANS